MADRYMQKCPASLTTQATMSHHLAPRMAIKTRKITNQDNRRRRRQNPRARLVGMLNSAADIESSMEVPQKLKPEMP
jgi:hypothetical protein